MLPDCRNAWPRFAFVCRLADERGTAVTSRTEEYRAKARECEERAEQTRDAFIKQELLEIARKWRRMTDHLEKYRGRASDCDG